MGGEEENPLIVKITSPLDGWLSQGVSGAYGLLKPSVTIDFGTVIT